MIPDFVVIPDRLAFPSTSIDRRYFPCGLIDGKSRRTVSML
jgi:hypothetical protein